MTGLLPRAVPVAGPPVETGFRLEVVCEVAVRVGEAFGVGEGEGEGETLGDGNGDGLGDDGASEAVATGMWAVVFCVNL